MTLAMLALALPKAAEGNAWSHLPSRDDTEGQSLDRLGVLSIFSGQGDQQLVTSVMAMTKSA